MDEKLFSKRNPTPEELQERINQAIELYNYSRSRLSDDQVASLRAYLSCDLYSYVADILKVSLEDEARCEMAAEKAEANCYVRHFHASRAAGLSASAAETMARKLTKLDDEYIESMKDLKSAELISEINSNIMKTATQVLHSMSYKSN